MMNNYHTGINYVLRTSTDNNIIFITTFQDIAHSKAMEYTEIFKQDINMERILIHEIGATSTVPFTNETGRVKRQISINWHIGRTIDEVCGEYSTVDDCIEPVKRLLQEQWKIDTGNANMVEVITPHFAYRHERSQGGNY